MSRTVSALLCLLPWMAAGSLRAEDPAQTYRIRVGSLEVTALQDCELKHSLSLLKGIDLAEAGRLMGSKDTVFTSLNTFLVRMGTHLVLVDAGGSSAMNPAMGHIVERLKALGIQPESIEAVLLTHCHGDHIGGLLAPGGTRAFPKAVIRVPQAEYDYWMDPATEAKLPESARPRIAVVKAALAPYQAAGALRPFAPGEAPFPGVEAMPAPGHTPGHTAYAFGSGAKAFWAVGDIVHFGKVQFPHPEVTVSFDTDGPKAAESRRVLWQKAAQTGTIMGGAHLPFPGMGRVKVQGQAFEWVPVR